MAWRYLGSVLMLACCATASLWAQNKKMTLDDAVLQQNRNFRADRWAGLQWLPGSQSYVYYTDNYTKVMKGTAPSAQAQEWFTLTQLNQWLGTKSKSLVGLQWINAHRLMLTEGEATYFYDFNATPQVQIVKLPAEAENVSWSADFQQVVYTKDHNLYAWRKGEEMTLTLEPEGIVSGQSIARNEFGTEKGIFWGPNNQSLAYYQKDERQVGQYPLLDLNVTPAKDQLIRYPMAGGASEKPRIGIYNFSTLATVYIKPRLGEDAYLTNLTWTPDGQYIVVAELNRGQNQLELNAYKAADGSFYKTFWTESHPKWVEPEHPAQFLDARSNDMVWISEKEGYMNAYSIRWKDGQIKPLTQNAFPIKSILGVYDRQLYFTATGPDPRNMWAFAVDAKGKQRTLTSEPGVHQVHVAEVGGWVFDEYSALNVPGVTQLLGGKSPIRCVTSDNKYKDYAMGSAEMLTLTAADGQTPLYARLIKPSNFDPNTKYPVLVYVYGGPHAQLVTNGYLGGANLWMYWMAEQGYLVFTLDNRGSDNRGFAFESVIHRQLGVEEMKDQLQGVAYLKSLPYVDANRLAVHGWSFGGFMTTSLMLRQPDVFKVGVAGGPVTDWKWYEVMYGERYMDTPAENPEGYQLASTLNHVQQLKGKLLLIHGTSDDVVVLQHNLALVKKCIEAQKQVDFFPYPMHKHNVVGKDRVHLMRKVLDYIIEHNL